MQVKTQKQVMALQNKAQKVADKLNEEVIVIAKGVQHIQVQAGTAYQLNAKDFDAKKSSLIAKKVGDDLEVALEEGVIIFDNYFAVCATDLSCLVSLPTEDGGLYHIVADVSFTLEDGTQIVYFYGDRSIVSTESSVVSANDNQSFSDVITSNIEVIAAVVVAAVVIASSSGNDGDGDNGDDKLSFTFKETGLLNNDGVTNDNTITVNGLKEGETWRYSIDSGNNFIPGTGRSFTLNDGTYGINTIQIKRTGDVSDISKNTSPIVIDTTDPIFDLQPTTVDIRVNAPIATTVYDAQVTNLSSGNADEGITYSIKGTNADKFLITDTGILTYKAIQTSVHNDDTVTIVATDIAGNETERPITVSVKIWAQGFAINGENAGDWSGFSVSTAGDVNGDGLDDLIVGVHKADLSGKSDTGRSYVVFGKTDNTAINLSAIALGTGGFVINGENTGDESGYSVSNAGDVNGDGLDDLIVGARNADPSGTVDAGKSYVVFGKTNNTAINLSAIALGTGGFVINGENVNNLSGASVSNAGDVNGDGLDDLIVGAFLASLNSKLQIGKSYIIFGKTNNTAINLSAIGTEGFVVNGENMNDYSGYSISTAGDVNGDGLDDLIVSAHVADSNGKVKAGKSYVIFGKEDSTTIDLSAIASGTGGFVINGENVNDESGFSVSNAGDVNGDGLDDLIVGAHKADLSGKSDAGKSYVVFGKTNNTAINLSDIASGTGGFVINGENAGDDSGISVSTAGDVNGDGLDDLIIGARYADLSNKLDAGKSYVVFGKTNNTAINLSAIALGTGGFVINGENMGNQSGFSVSTAGDVNGDGLDDLIIGAYKADPGSEVDAGKSYVIFGKTNTDAIDLTKLSGDLRYAIDYLGNENANTLTGTSGNEIFVAGAGDDTLIGNGGMDVFNAGAGNDTITINASNITALAQTGTGNRARVDGGGNIDTLVLDGGGLTLDLTNISNIRIQDIEKIDITGSGDNDLILNLNNVLDASTSTNILKVLGNSGDSVNASGFAKISGDETEGSITYDVYTHSGANTDANAALWVQQDINLIIL